MPKLSFQRANYEDIKWSICSVRDENVRFDKLLEDFSNKNYFENVENMTQLNFSILEKKAKV